jgi:hypothetical protein
MVIIHLAGSGFQNLVGGVAVFIHEGIRIWDMSAELF